MNPPPSPPAKCPQCKKVFPNEKGMVQHMEAAFKDSGFRNHIHCYHCKKYFPSHDAMDAHLKRVSSHSQLPRDCYERLTDP